MDELRMRGGIPLVGTVPTSGSKNASLAILMASLLCEEACVFSDIPQLQDVESLLELLHSLGVHSQVIPGELRSLRLSPEQVGGFEVSDVFAQKTRASIFALGPLLARFGRAVVSLPGGCGIGARPVEIHLEGLQQLGAHMEWKNGCIHAHLPQGRFQGRHVALRFPSVGATVNLMLAATLAEGVCVFENVACEPEIEDLAKALQALGACVEGAGTSQIRIQGVQRLRGGSYQVMKDRIEAGTFLLAGFLTQGRVKVQSAPRHCLGALLLKLEQAGAKILYDSDGIVIEGGRSQAVSVTTLPYPGFPTDLQAQFMSLMTLAEGSSCITETIFENRFMHVLELVRMGANIESHGNLAVVKGVKKMTGAEVMATDLRASVSLALAALASEGETAINRLYHLERGYERLAEKLIACGADIKVLY